nr:MAG TPA: hypothetical protein [Caudoviricetes sp.]
MLSSVFISICVVINTIFRIWYHFSFTTLAKPFSYLLSIIFI